MLEELSNAVGGDNEASPAQLLPEDELYQRTGLNTKLLAERLQSERGVRIVDRRWHWKLHHHCMIGAELTTWLLDNFKDINTRDEARDLGNELMRDGLFRHVERRHDFRDGHYFYQITDEYRAARPESRGFLGWVKASVPQTPFKEAASKQAAPTEKADAETGDAPRSTESYQAAEKKPRPTVALGKSLIYNLTHSRQKVSYREELMNLHYDRLHNPDACYHIRVEWMNTTSKLIQDAVNHWAMIVEAYGLRLVEVPIGEVSAITSMHPFRAPYLIKLAREPPSMTQNDYFEAKKSISQEKNHCYQKAILSRFNYVLDFEAATDFPSDVDVTYSWGKPDYRFPQYIHRSGLLIAQINEEGHLLVLANRLYNNKSARARTKPTDEILDFQAERSPISHRSNPLRQGDGLTQRSSPKASPSSSPALRAAMDIPNSFASGSRSRLVTTTTQSPSKPHTSSVSSSASTANPERLTRELQDFCNNVEALEAFYTEQQSKATTPSSSTPSSATPLTYSRKTPSRAPESTIDENSIPELTLPSSWSERENMWGIGTGTGTRVSRGAGRGESRSPKSRSVE